MGKKPQHVRCLVGRVVEIKVVKVLAGIKSYKIIIGPMPDLR